MQNRLAASWKHLALEQQFLLAGLVVLLSLMLLIGNWVNREIVNRVTDQTALNSALYVNSAVSPLLDGYIAGESLAPATIDAFERLLHDTPLGDEVVSLKLWSTDGRLLYGSNSSAIDVAFPIHAPLAAALRGTVNSHISDLEDAENISEQGLGSQLIETYIPMRDKDNNRIFAVAEFYQNYAPLRASLNTAQRKTWLLVGLATVVGILFLAAIVRPGSRTIAVQQRELERRVQSLSVALAENDELNRRVRSASARTVAINERFLKRIAAELHDGPAQSLGLALLRLDATSSGVNECDDAGAAAGIAAGLDEVQGSLQSALQETRSIAVGLALPELAHLSLAETIEKVAHAHEQKLGGEVTVELEQLPEEASLPLKFTVYRIIQEALYNGSMHGKSKHQTVRITGRNECLETEIADHGIGFDAESDFSDSNHLGIAGMQERVQSLGGTFSISSTAESGTRVAATLPCAARIDG